MAAAPVGLNEEHVPANPFANYGPPVTGTGFVGRWNEVTAIRNRTFALLETASVSIIGPPRIGKSSLARQVLDEFASGISPRGLAYLPVWITVSSDDDEDSLFRELARQAHEWLADRDLLTDKLRRAYDALRASVAWRDLRLCLRTYLKDLRASGYQVIAVVDEFDAVRNVFTRAAPFELQRQIAYEPGMRIAWIITSRRKLKDIVIRSNAAASTFPGIFGQPEILGCFDCSELAELIARSPYQGETLRKMLLSLLERETGGQPFLSSALLSVLHDRWAAEGPPLEASDIEDHFTDALVTCGQLIVDHHGAMIELLREENRLTKLFEVIFGPQITVGKVDAERLAQEGIIKETAEGWMAYSESFHQYLSRQEEALTSDSHMLWPKTEVGLRSALAAALESAYGPSWQSTLEESQSRIVRNCERRRAHDPGARTGDGGNLLDYTVPAELLQIMMVHWGQVEPVFGHDKGEWRTRLEFVAKARTPLAHSRRGSMPPQDLERFRSTCQEILRWLESAGAARAD